MRAAVAALLLLAACGAPEPAAPEPRTAATASPVDATVERGRVLYGQVCAACHGADLEGTDSGPPLTDPIYRPDHHPDQAFLAAMRNGAPQHHWDFGPMPPQPVEDKEASAILAYIRSRQ